MAVMLSQFIDKFKAMEKIANETLAADPEALVGVDSMPGAEHDKPVPADAKKPDPEVAQGQPEGAESASGAVNGGDAKPLNEGKLEMDQPLENPEQKPLVSDDALTAKTANEHLVSLVGDLLKDLKGEEKSASCGGGGATHAAAPAKPAEKKDEKDGEGKEPEKQVAKVAEPIRLDDETINKIAAAQAAFMLGREAADKALKKTAEAKKSLTPEMARALIKESCIKAAQADGLDPAAAAAAADNAMLTAGMPAADAAATDAAAADAAAADAGADASAADAGATAAEAEIPEDVTEEELATAIVDLVQSGELDVDTAKAIVEEIAGDDASAGPTEDQAAEIIAQGLESGEITPEQAQQIAAAVEGGDAAQAEPAPADAEAQGAAPSDAEAQGAAAAEEAVQDAKDEAAGAAAAEDAIKKACAQIRSNALGKVAGAIVAKRAEKRAAAKKDAQPQLGSRIMSKVAGILKEKVEKKAAAQAPSADESKFIDGFRKKAEEMGVDPKALAKYVCDSQSK